MASALSNRQQWSYIHRCRREVAPDDRLFLQRLVRSSDSGRYARQFAAHDKPGLRLSRLQRAVWAVRANDQTDHDPGNRHLFPRLHLLPPRPGGRSGARGRRGCGGGRLATDRDYASVQFYCKASTCHGVRHRSVCGDVRRGRSAVRSHAWSRWDEGRSQGRRVPQ
jgi:hypothetical protein